MISHEEMAFRRGLHQAFAQAYAWSIGIAERDRLTETLGMAEDAACLLRESQHVHVAGLDFVRSQIQGGQHPPLARDA